MPQGARQALVPSAGPPSPARELQPPKVLTNVDLRSREGDLPAAGAGKKRGNQWRGGCVNQC
eukprot:2674037-Rhodomonas_salina.1